MIGILGKFIPTTWEIYAIIFLAGLLSGGWAVHKLYEADQAAQLSETIKTNQATVRLVNRAGSAYLAQQRQKDAANEKTITDLRRRLANAPACNVPVPAEWVRPSGELPDAAGPRSKSGSTGTQVEAVADCRQVVESCELNRERVCEPAADQADAIRRLWKEMQGRINR